MRQVYKLGLGFALSLTVGCAPTGFDPIVTGSEKTRKDNLDNPPVQKTCEVDPVDYEIDMQVINFEMTDRTNFKFGFNLLSGWVQAIGLSADIKGGRLDMEMALYNTMNPDEALVDVVDKASFTDSSFGFRLDAGQLGADLGYYHRTPLAKLSNAAIANTFKHLLKNAKNDKVLPTWNARVTSVYAIESEARVTIAAGRIAGLLENDLITIYNVREHWEDPKKPCGSRWTGTEKLLDEPIQAQVVALGPNRSVVKLLGASVDQVKVGAIAELKATSANKNRKLRRSLRIGQMAAAPIKIQGVGEVDIMKFMHPQIDPVVRENGYYLVD